MPAPSATCTRPGRPEPSTVRRRGKRTASQPIASAAKPRPWATSSGASSVPSAITSTNSTSGITSAGQAARVRRATHNPPAPASRASTSGSARNSPSPSTGASVVRNSIQPVTSEVPSEVTEAPVGRNPHSVSRGTASGPPSRK